MKKVLYTMPAIMVAVFYAMLALLAGGFASLQLRAWLMIGLPAASAILLLAGKWWGALSGMALGGILMGQGILGGNEIVLFFGGIVFAYYLVMGILCLADNRKKSKK